MLCAQASPSQVRASHAKRMGGAERQFAAVLRGAAGLYPHCLCLCAACVCVCCCSGRLPGPPQGAGGRWAGASTARRRSARSIVTATTSWCVPCRWTFVHAALWWWAPPPGAGTCTRRCDVPFPPVCAQRRTGCARTAWPTPGSASARRTALCSGPTRPGRRAPPSPASGLTVRPRRRCTSSLLCSRTRCRGTQVAAMSCRGAHRPGRAHHPAPPARRRQLHAGLCVPPHVRRRQPGALAAHRRPRLPGAGAERARVPGQVPAQRRVPHLQLPAVAGRRRRLVLPVPLHL